MFRLDFLKGQLRLVGVGLLGIFILGCVGIKSGMQPVQDFELPRYLGKWYEIARLDHSFERGLSKVTAEYSLRDDGGINVLNTGYSASEQSWESAEGKAYFARDTDEGYLKVSFFGPFYGSYVIFELQENYEYAFVASYNSSYLWLLARTPTVEQAVLDEFIRQAKQHGFNTDELIFND